MKKRYKKIWLIAVLTFAFQLIFPQYSHAYDNQIVAAEDSLLAINNLSTEFIYDPLDYKKSGRLEPANWREPRKTIKVAVTAYSSTPDQTDSTPFITANGTHVKDGIVAANFLPFGAKIKLPEVYGDKVFTVEDRMNKRYYYRLDIWMPTREAAKQFGVQYLEVEIF